MKTFSSTDIGSKFVWKPMSLMEFSKHFTKYNTDFSPREFQRMFRTVPKKQKDIIKAMLEGEMTVPIHMRICHPSSSGVYYNEHIDTSKEWYQCLDGLQRSTILNKFLNNELLCPKIEIRYNGRKFVTKGEMSYSEMLTEPNSWILRETMEKQQSLMVVEYNISMQDHEAICKFQQLNNNTPISRPEMRDGYNSILSDYTRSKVTWGTACKNGVLFGQRAKLFDFDINTETVNSGKDNFNLLTQATGTAAKRVPIHAIKANRKKSVQGYYSELVFMEHNAYDSAKPGVEIDDPFKKAATEDAIDELYDYEDYRHIDNNGEENLFAYENAKPFLDKLDFRCTWVENLLRFPSFNIRRKSLDWTAIRMLFMLSHGLENYYKRPLNEIKVNDTFAHNFVVAHMDHIAQQSRIAKENKSEYCSLLGLHMPHQEHKKLNILMQWMKIGTDVNICGVSVIDKIRSFSFREKVARHEQVGGKCEYCETEISVEESVADHAIPYSEGGKTEYSNLRLSCKSCNTKKGPLFEDEFRMVLKTREEKQVA